MQDFINQAGGPFPAILLVVVAFNTFMMGLKAGLEKIKDKTTNQVDNKVYDFTNKIVSFLSGVIDVFTGNLAHPKPQAPTPPPEEKKDQ